MSAEITLPVGQQSQNIVRLATAQALAGANSVVFYATGAIVGNAIAPSPTLATLPITIFVLARAGALAGHGRRRGGGDHRPDAGDRDHEFVAAAHLCDDLYRSGAGGGGIRAGLAGSKNPRAGGAGQIGRAPAGRNRAPAGVFPDGF